MRSKTADNRLNHLMSLYVHKQETDGLDINAICVVRTPGGHHLGIIKIMTQCTHHVQCRYGVDMSKRKNR